MLPTLRDGDFLAVRSLRAGEPRPGQIVVAVRDGAEIVKRVGPAPEPLAPGTFWLEGDNKRASTDSRTGGPFDREHIAGIVRLRYWPPTGMRLLR